MVAHPRVVDILCLLLVALRRAYSQGKRSGNDRSTTGGCRAYNPPMARKGTRSTIKHYILATDASTTRIHCYAALGIGRYHCPVIGTELEVVLINVARKIRQARGRVTTSWHIQVDDAPYPSEWRVLGFRYGDGSLPKGPLEVVDPELAIFEDLIVANTPPPADHTAGQTRLA